jgi:hypothetical protein
MLLLDLIHFLKKLHIILKAAHVFDPLQRSSNALYIGFLPLILLAIPRRNFGEKNMFELRKKTVQMFSQEEIFLAIPLGALKARAGRLGPGEIINIGEFEMIVAEDENGEGIVVQIIETMADMESLVMARVRTQDRTIGGWSDHERRVWLAAFWSDLAQYLNTWQGIKMRLGPGEHITFEKAVCR